MFAASQNRAQINDLYLQLLTMDVILCKEKILEGNYYLNLILLQVTTLLFIFKCLNRLECRAHSVIHGLYLIRFLSGLWFRDKEYLYGKTYRTFLYLPVIC